MILPLFILILFFLVDGMISNFFNSQLHFSFGYMIPRLTIICFIIFTFHMKSSYVFWIGLIIGFLFDSYYSGILGVYMASFCLMSYFTTYLGTYFYPGWLSYIFIGTLMLLFNELLVFSVYNLLDIVGETYSQFFANYLGATLVGNFIVLLLLIPLLRKIASFVSE